MKLLSIPRFFKKEIYRCSLFWWLGSRTCIRLKLLIYLDLILDFFTASSAMFVVLLLNFVFSLDSQLLKVELPVYSNLRQHALKGCH